jgi:hypothetical protein
MSSFAIACYRPHPGREVELMELVHGQYAVLQIEGLVTERPPYLMQSNDGTIVQVFEWKSKEAKEATHENLKVREVWEQMMNIATFPPLSGLEETSKPFANFTAL